MKKISKVLLFLMVSVLFSFSAKAQFEEGQSDINLGVGFVTFGLNGDGALPISVSYEYGINENISVGGFAGYVSSTEDFSGSGFDYTWKYTYIIVGVRGAYHKELVDGIDTYAGILLGYNAASATFEGDESIKSFITEPSVGGIAYGIYAGGRYHFTDNIGAFLELGYGISAVNLGLTFKF